MDFSKLIPSGVARQLGTKIAKGLLTRASAEAAKPVLLGLFKDRMNAASRAVLAGRLEGLAAHLRAGELAKASEVGGEIIGDVEL